MPSGEDVPDHADTTVERSSPTRVLVVDDHLGFARLLSAALDQEPDLHSVGVATNQEEALGRAAEVAPDLALLDIQMAGSNGIEVARALRRAHPRLLVVVMTAHTDPIWADRALEAGAATLVAKDGSLDTLLDAVRHVRDGG